MALEANDRVLVIPLGVRGTVVRLRGEDEVVVLADCAARPVVWKRKELADVQAADRRA